MESVKELPAGGSFPVVLEKRTASIFSGEEQAQQTYKPTSASIFQLGLPYTVTVCVSFDLEDEYSVFLRKVVKRLSDYTGHIQEDSTPEDKTNLLSV
jgi:hypothetical protein